MLIKNIQHDEVINLKDMISIRKHEVISRTIAQNDAVSITLFAFDQGEEISTHASKGDAMVQILEGSAHISINQQHYEIQAGESIIMSANSPHALFAKEAFKMLLTVVFPTVEGEN